MQPSTIDWILRNARIADDTPLGSGGGWYAQAKRDAEALLASLKRQITNGIWQGELCCRD